MAEYKGIGTYFKDLFSNSFTGKPASTDHAREFFTNNPLGQVLTGVGIGDAYLEEQMQIDAEERQQEHQIEAEQRANAEYDRRMADERAYNDPSAQAERMRVAGINPMASLGTTVQSSTTKSSAPSNSSPSMANPSGHSSVDIVGLAQASANIKKTQAETKLIEEQSSNQYEQGYSAWLSNCLTRVMNGDKDDLGKDTAISWTFIGDQIRDFEFRYDVSIDGDNIEIVPFVPNDVHPDSVDGFEFKHGVDARHMLDSLKDVPVYTFNSSKYGQTRIVGTSPTLKRISEDIQHLVGENKNLANDAASCFVNLYVAFMDAVSNSNNADSNARNAKSNELRALAEQLAANFNYGDESSWKYWLETIKWGVSTGADLWVTYKTATKKGGTFKQTKKYDSKGNFIGGKDETIVKY